MARSTFPSRTAPSMEENVSLFSNTTGRFKAFAHFAHQIDAEPGKIAVLHHREGRTLDRADAKRTRLLRGRARGQHDKGNQPPNPSPHRTLRLVSSLDRTVWVETESAKHTTLRVGPSIGRASGPRPALLPAKRAPRAPALNGRSHVPAPPAQVRRDFSVVQGAPISPPSSRLIAGRGRGWGPMSATTARCQSRLATAQ